MQALQRLSCCLVLLSAGGCMGGDSSNSVDGSGTFSSGVDTSKRVDALSASEAQEICQSSADYVDDYIKSGEYEEFICRLFGLGVAVQVVDSQLDTCKSQYDMCIKQVTVTVAPSADCTVPASCSATVGDLEQCLNDQDMSISSTNIPTCSEVDFSTFTQDSLDAMTSGLEPSSCKMLDSQCDGASNLVNPDVQAHNLPGG